MFIYPKFEDGVKVVTRMQGETASMLQNITVYQMKKGEELSLLDEGCETAVLLLEGDITYFYEDKEVRAKRRGVFIDPATCLHVCKDTEIVVVANANSEILVQSTNNEKEFEPVLYTKDNIRSFVSCDGKWENTAVRDVVDVITIKVAPYSNMVLGEVMARQGRWWSYIPHHHPQPEVYYYKFDKSREGGFGACFIGEEAHTIKDGSAGLFEGGKNHAQVTAPGYPMYCAWMIRHLDGDIWDNTRTDDPRYSWLLKSNKIWN